MHRYVAWYMHCVQVGASGRTRVEQKLKETLEWEQVCVVGVLGPCSAGQILGNGANLANGSRGADGVKKTRGGGGRRAVTRQDKHATLLSLNQPPTIVHLCQLPQSLSWSTLKDKRCLQSVLVSASVPLVSASTCPCERDGLTHGRHPLSRTIDTRTCPA